MIKKCYLEEVRNEDKVSKAGKPYVSCSLKIENKWHNGFGNKSTQAFQQGQTVELDIFSEDYQGKTYWKFKTVSQDDKKFAEITEKVEKLTERLNTMARFLKSKFPEDLKS